MDKEESIPAQNNVRKVKQWKRIGVVDSTQNKKEWVGINAREWIDPISLLKDNLRCNNNMISSSELVFGSTIFKGKYKVSISFCGSLQLFTSIGITDSANRKRQRGQWSGFNIYYDCFGEIWKNWKFIERVGGFRGGDVVSILGDTARGLVTFKVGDKIVYVGSYELENKDTELVAYIADFRCIGVRQSFSQVDVLMVNMLMSMYEWDYDVVYEVNGIIMVNEIDDISK